MKIKEKTISELYAETKLPQELLEEISKTGEGSFEKFVENKYKKVDEKEKEVEQENKLLEIYRNIIEILKEWCDLKEEYYNIVTLWIIGTYLHNEFPSYPFLFFNAMRGSGKSRILKLITFLANNGTVLNSLTEAELFRSKGTLGIDEFEDLDNKEKNSLRELLNSAYKKGTKVRRMRKVRVKDGERQEVEEFDVYRPICLANISGMEDVLNDRCITLILEKSSKTNITNLMEIFENDEKIIATKLLLNEIKCSLCSVVTIKNIYTEWNNYVKLNYTNYTNNTLYTNYTNYTFDLIAFKRIKSEGINGRELELSFPLFLLSHEICGLDGMETTLNTISSIMKEKREESLVENRDISLFDFLSQEPEEDFFISISQLSMKFINFLQTDDNKEINPKWIGRALKRLGLIIEKRRVGRGVEIRVNYKKAQEKIKMFK